MQVYLLWAAIWALVRLAHAQDFTFVTSLIDFQQALNQSAPHIVIGAHLDLTNAIPLPGNMTSPAGVAANWGGTKSIRGNCTNVPVPFALAVTKPRESQCVLTVLNDFLENEGQMWISDLYIALQRPPDMLQVATVFANRGDLVLSHVVISGGGSFARALDIQYPQTNEWLSQAPWLQGRRGRLYAEDCVLDGFFQERHSAARLSPNATATFHHVTFSNSRTATTPAAAGPALGLQATLEGEAVQQPSAAWLQECMFVNNTSPKVTPVSVQQASRVYVSELSTEPGAVWDETNRVVALPWTLKPILDPETVAARTDGGVMFNAAAEGFISGGEEWLKAIVQEQAQASSMPLGIISPIDTNLIAVPPPPTRPSLPAPPSSPLPKPPPLLRPPAMVACRTRTSRWSASRSASACLSSSSASSPRSSPCATTSCTSSGSALTPPRATRPLTRCCTAASSPI
eukprot:jgi/Ulvmu1/2155/UM129_0015.1